MFYPVVLRFDSEQNHYQISVPDLPGCDEICQTIDNGLHQVKFTIANHLSILAEYGEAIPQAKEVGFWQQQQPTGIWALVEIDITPYLGKSHKINVTLPELLIKQIDDRVSKSDNYKTRSGFIATACINELTLKD
ncbi:type II toxin-antitoxin system HicB family antitoxin [Thalassotalea atypica]|uniref:type II toxin-antitoxin system HicB family antitoxin n=1 Tax=Thalassotalea atypica TaxID=2054316 RepID=UPI002573B625|nr:type II toxin-antitoxin system HicB family antitoxin [Thalassotalea atypica]